MSITILSGPAIIGSVEKYGETYYGWAYTVEVDGQVYIVVEWVDTNDLSYDSQIQQDVIDDILNGSADLGGIAQNDGVQQDGYDGYPGGVDGYDGYDGFDGFIDGDDGVLADGGAGDDYSGSA